MSTPAGWYPAPEQDGRQRYWDGTQWTEHYAPGAPTGQQAEPETVDQEVEPETAAAQEGEEEIDPKGLRPDIAQAVKGRRYGGKREIKKLETHLHENEVVDKIVTGTYAGGTGIVVLTDKRLMFVKDGWTSKTSEDFPFSRISSINWHTGMLLGQIDIHVQGLKSEIKNVQKDAGKLIVDRTRHHISKGDQPTSAVQATPAPAAAAAAAASAEPDVYEQLRKLAELRTAGVITDEEFEAKKQVLMDRI